MQPATFALHPQLQQDSLRVGHFSLCELRLMNDNHYPWFILIPQRANISEIYQLNKADQQQLQTESCYLAKQLAAAYHPDKLNIATIGNIVPQLHIHHIVRYYNDKAWPAPVWGKFSACPYTEEQRQQQIALLRTCLDATVFNFTV